RRQNKTPNERSDGMKWKRVVPVLALVFAFCGFASAPLFAQAVQTATLTGTVKDTTGGVLPGVTVNVSSPSQIGGVQTAVTDTDGIYRFPALHPGLYEMEAKLPGFRTVRRTDIRLPLGTTITLDVTLDVASTAETVNEIGASPVVDVKSSASNTQIPDSVL